MHAVAADVTGIAQRDLRLPPRVTRPARTAVVGVQSAAVVNYRGARNPLSVLASRAARLEAEHGSAVALGSLIERMGGAPGSAARGDFLSVRA